MFGLRRRKILFIALLCVAALAAAFYPQLRLGMLAALFATDLLEDASVASPESGALAWVTATPSVRAVSIPSDGRTIGADLYHLPDEKRRAAILLTHGIIETGKNDPRLVRFARSLARAGFVVLVPDLAGMKALKVVWSDVDDIIAAFRYLASLGALVDPRRLGLMGFSYAAGPTLMAAANPTIRDRVSFVVSFGGYYDPINVIRFITTGHYGYGDEKGFLKPEPYGKWVFFINNLDHVENPTDQKLLKEIFLREQESDRAGLSSRLNRLTPQGRALYELLTNQDPDRVDALVRKIDPRVRAYLERLSMEPVVPLISAYMIVGHGTGDPLIPYTESLRLADAVADKRRVHVAILRLFTHVDPAGRSASWAEYVTVRLPSMLEFYALVYDLLRRQRE